VLLVLLTLIASSSLEISTLQANKTISIITSVDVYHIQIFILQRLVRFRFVDGARGRTTRKAWCQAIQIVIQNIEVPFHVHSIIIGQECG
jgi:hypothetical protein